MPSNVFAYDRFGHALALSNTTALASSLAKYDASPGALRPRQTVQVVSTSADVGCPTCSGVGGVFRLGWKFRDDYVDDGSGEMALAGRSTVTRRGRGARLLTRGVSSLQARRCSTRARAHCARRGRSRSTRARRPSRRRSRPTLTRACCASPSLTVARVWFGSVWFGSLERARCDHRSPVVVAHHRQAYTIGTTRRNDATRCAGDAPDRTDRSRGCDRTDGFQVRLARGRRLRDQVVRVVDHVPQLLWRHVRRGPHGRQSRGSAARARRQRPARRRRARRGRRRQHDPADCARRHARVHAR